MKLVLADARIWRNIIGALSLLDEANFFVHKKGIELRASDPTRVAMVDLKLPKKAFEKFKVKSEETIRLGIDFGLMNDICKRAKPGEHLEITLSDNKAELSLSFTDKRTRTFNITLLDLGEKEAPAPKSNPEAKIKMSTEALAYSLGDCALFSTAVLLKADMMGLNIVGAGDAHNTKVFIDSGSDDIHEYDLTAEEVSAIYSLDYLKTFANAGISDVIGLDFKNSFPIKVSYPLSGGGELAYYLAPRIEKA